MLPSLWGSLPTGLNRIREEDDESQRKRNKKKKEKIKKKKKRITKLEKGQEYDVLTDGIRQRIREPKQNKAKEKKITQLTYTENQKDWLAMIGKGKLKNVISEMTIWKRI